MMDLNITYLMGNSSMRSVRSYKPPLESADREEDASSAVSMVEEDDDSFENTESSTDESEDDMQFSF